VHSNAYIYIAYPNLPTTIVLIQGKDPAELYKICFWRYYKHAWWHSLMLVVWYSTVHLWHLSAVVP